MVTALLVSRFECRMMVSEEGTYGTNVNLYAHSVERLTALSLSIMNRYYFNLFVTSQPRIHRQQTGKEGAFAVPVVCP